MDKKQTNALWEQASIFHLHTKNDHRRRLVAETFVRQLRRIRVSFATNVTEAEMPVTMVTISTCTGLKE